MLEALLNFHRLILLRRTREGRNGQERIRGVLSYLWIALSYSRVFLIPAYLRKAQSGCEHFSLSPLVRFRNAHEGLSASFWLGNDLRDFERLGFLPLSETFLILPLRRKWEMNSGGGRGIRNPSSLSTSSILFIPLIILVPSLFHTSRLMILLTSYPLFFLLYPLWVDWSLSDGLDDPRSLWEVSRGSASAFLSSVWCGFVLLAIKT